MVDPVKVAAVVKKIRDQNRKSVEVPEADKVKGMPSQEDGNLDETGPRQESPTEHNMPEDIGPMNDQTISGTGHGPTLGAGNRDNID